MNTSSENIGRGLTIVSLFVGQEEWTNSRHKAPPARTTKGVYRDQPYARYWLYCLMLWNIQSPPVLYTVQSNFFYEQSLFINSKRIKKKNPEWMDWTLKSFVERTTWTERNVNRGTLFFPNCIWDKIGDQKNNLWLTSVKQKNRFTKSVSPFF